MCNCGSRLLYTEAEGNEAYEFEQSLDEVKVDFTKWRVLYRCPECGAYWEETRPHSELQGGGSPVLTRVSKEYVAREWGVKDR